MIFPPERVRFTQYMYEVFRSIRPGQQPVTMHVPFDFETFLIQPALTAPKLVCMSALPVAAEILGQVPGHPPHLLHANFDREALFGMLQAMLRDPHALISGANVSYDLLVAMNEFPELLEPVFDALDQNRVVCVQLAQQLNDIATNQYEGTYLPDGTWVPLKYSLQALAKRHLGVDMDKDTWRLKYGTLWEVPTHAWDQGAIDYSVGDSVVGGAILQAIVDPYSLGTPDTALRSYLQGTTQRVGADLTLIDLFRQTRAQVWIALMVARGFRVDPWMVSLLKGLIERERDQVGERLRQAGLVRADGSKDTKAAAARMEVIFAQRGMPHKTTAKGQVSLDEDACLESGDGILADYAAFTSLGAILSKDLGALEPPARAGMPVQSHFKTLTETGRTSCSGGGKAKNSTTYSYQLQNLRRQLGIKRLEELNSKIDELIGVRQCFTPRDGFHLSSNDFSMFEACSWCQASIDIGRPVHRMIEALNAGHDVHLRLAARWLKLSYEEVAKRKKEPEIKETRQRSKPGTFGFMGGMGWRTFIIYAKGTYQVIFLPPEAQAIRKAWYGEWEPEPYFDYITHLVGQANMGEVVQVRSLRRRAWVPYTVASNSFFQGLAADCAKDAGFEITREMFTGRTRSGHASPLEGSRIVNFVHDEFLCEHPVDLAHEGAHRVAELMEEAGRRWMPDVPPKVVPALMRRWIKSAEERFDENKRLIPYEPEAA